jgi:hypothetical protein
MYLIFFGKSQDFTSCYYDKSNKIEDFNAILKDFDLLESKIFTVDDVNNKEILSRYLFSTQNQNYCLIKLYSFAQAYSGNRIAGSIYGVGLLSDKLINFTKSNLELLRAAKDNFAKLSLEGFKFNKSNFQNDSDRIWKAIISNSEGNLLEKISTSPLHINGNKNIISFCVKNLFSDAIRLNESTQNKDKIYLSTDLDHLKRNQSKWSKESFPIYIYSEKENKFILSHENVDSSTKNKKASTSSGDTKTKDSIQNEIALLKSELADAKHNNESLQRILNKTKEKHKTFTYTIYTLIIFILILIIYITFGIKQDKPELPKMPEKKKAQSIDLFLNDVNATDSGIVFLEAVKFIYTFDVTKDSNNINKFHKNFETLTRINKINNLNIENINKIYQSKCNEISKNKPIQAHNDATIIKKSKMSEKKDKKVQKNNP